MRLWLLWVAMGLAEEQAPPLPAVVADLLEAASQHVLDEGWLARQPLNPALNWEEALRPTGPVLRTLSQHEGVARIDRMPDAVLVALQTDPGLVATVDSAGTLLELQVTTCPTCAPAERFVRDLIADIKRRGTLGARLVPGLELDVASHLAANPSLGGQHWSASVETYFHLDRDLAHMLGNVTLDRVDEQVILVTYPDGTQDWWEPVWRGQRFMLNYASLSPDSPLRLSSADARRWRRRSHRQSQYFETWRPPRRTDAKANGQLLGTSVIDAWYMPEDDTVWMAVFDYDRTAALLARVEPVTRELLEKQRLPSLPSSGILLLRDWFRRHHAKPADSGQDLGLVLHHDLMTYDLDTQRTSKVAWVSEISTLSWGRHEHRNTLLASEVNGTLHLVSPEGYTARHGAPLVWVDLDDGVLTRLSTRGDLLRAPISALDQPPLARGVCAGHPTDAGLRPSDGLIAVTCGPEAPHQIEIHSIRQRTPRVVGSTGLKGTGVAFSPDDRWLATPAPEGGLHLWDTATWNVVQHLGHATLSSVMFSPDGQHLLAVFEDGMAWTWPLTHLPTSLRGG